MERTEALHAEKTASPVAKIAYGLGITNNSNFWTEKVPAGELERIGHLFKLGVASKLLFELDEEKIKTLHSADDISPLIQRLGGTCCMAIYALTHRKRDIRKWLSAVVKHKETHKPVRTLLPGHTKVEQVIVLGAGMDPMVTDKVAREDHDYQQVTFFEVDKPENMELKETKLASAHLKHSNVHFIAADYTTEEFINILHKAGVDPAKSTHIIWEGNTTYLTTEQLRAVLTRLNDFFTRFTLHVDTMSSAVVNKTTVNIGLDNLHDIVSNMGAAFQSNEEDFIKIIKELGITRCETKTMQDLAREYGTHQNFDRDGGEHVSLHLLRK